MPHWRSLLRSALLLLLRELICWLIACFLPVHVLATLLESLQRHAQNSTPQPEDRNVPL